MKRIFKITLLKWGSHNKGHKNSFKKTQISNNFCTDAKLLTLPLCVRWLYLGLILECGNSNNDTVTISERQLNVMLTTRLGCMNALVSLQSLQMLTFEVSDPPIQNRNEMKLKEKKRNSVKGKGLEKSLVTHEQQNLIPASPNVEPSADVPDSKIYSSADFIATYVKCFQARYKGARPEISGKTAGQVKSFLAKFPIDRAKLLIQIYLQMEDPWFVKKHHDLTTFFENLNKITVAMQTGVNPDAKEDKYDFLRKKTKEVSL